MQATLTPQTPPAPPPPATKPGHEVIVDILLEHGTDTVFGYSGAAVIPLFDAIYERNVQAFKEAICDGNPNRKYDKYSVLNKLQELL